MIRGSERSAVAATMRRFACWAVLLAAAGLINGGSGSGSHRISASALRREDRFGRFPFGAGGGGYAEDPEVVQGELPCRNHSACSRTCEEMNGSGSFNTTCVIASSSSLDGDVCVYGAGSVEIRAGVKIICPLPGCYVVFNVSGSIAVGERVEVVAGSVSLYATNLSLGRGSTVNTTGLPGAPPPQTSGTPHSLEGAGGGHGGRGASCKVSNDTNWGGDVYAWAFLDNPWSYGSKGGSLSADEKLGGDGGGRVLLRASELLSVDGDVLAEGGVGNLRGGGGSGGSIMIKAFKLWTEFWMPPECWCSRHNI